MCIFIHPRAFCRPPGGWICRPPSACFVKDAYRGANPSTRTRAWFAWQNTLFGELILKLIDEGKVSLLNNIE